MRDHVLGAIAWLEHFVPDFPRPQNKLAKNTAFKIEEAWIFEPTLQGRANERPFDFVLGQFEMRRRIKDEIERSGNYDIREKALKLSLNSIYGKLAQSVGREGKAPAVANPYYAAATTAYCQRRLLKAALLDPHAIVFFATDGIVSTRELQGLSRVRKKGEIVDLGDWEYSGQIAVSLCCPVSTRTARSSMTKMAVGPSSPSRNCAAPRGSKEQFPRIVAPYKKYITVGNALASRETEFRPAFHDMAADRME
jgi:hypothetical protein